jgi:hypothetical protein
LQEGEPPATDHFSAAKHTNQKKEEKSNDRHERMSHPVCPTLQNCRRTNRSYFTDFCINHRIFGFVTVRASSISPGN